MEEHYILANNALKEKDYNTFIANIVVCAQNDYKDSRDIYCKYYNNIKCDIDFIKLLDQENEYVQHILSVLYYHMDNFDKTREYLEKSINKECPVAFAEFGFISDITNRHDVSMTYLQKSVDMGCLTGIIYLGMKYNMGIGVEINYEKAKELFEKAVNRGSPRAMEHLGGMYINGKGVEINYSKAIELFTKAVELKYPNAFNSLAIMYIFGIGTEIDYVKAKELLEEGCKLGCVDTNISLAVMYQKGYIGKDCKKSIELYTKVLKQKPNNPNALNNLRISLNEKEMFHALVQQLVEYETKITMLKNQHKNLENKYKKLKEEISLIPSYGSN